VTAGTAGALPAEGDGDVEAMTAVRHETATPEQHRGGGPAGPEDQLQVSRDDEGFQGWRVGAEIGPGAAKARVARAPVGTCCGPGR